MSIFRKIISGIVFALAIVLLVGVCMSTSMKPVYTAIKDSFSPFDFQNVIDAIMLFVTRISTPLVLMMLGFLGLTLPGSRR